MLTPDPANEDKLLRWIAAARAADLPHLRLFTPGLDLDIKAATQRSRSPTTTGERKASTRRRKIKRDMFGARRLRAPAPPHPARIRSRITTTGSATEPLT
jgi:hypothetical protein